jgi:hypothetical protein
VMVITNSLSMSPSEVAVNVGDNVVFAVDRGGGRSQSLAGQA